MIGLFMLFNWNLFFPRCCLLKTFANSLDPDQAWQKISKLFNTLMKNFFQNVNLGKKIYRPRQTHEKLSFMQREKSWKQIPDMPNFSIFDYEIYHTFIKNWPCKMQFSKMWFLKSVWNLKQTQLFVNCKSFMYSTVRNILRCFEVDWQPSLVTQAWPIPYPLHSSSDECSGYGMGHAWVTKDDWQLVSSNIKILLVKCWNRWYSEKRWKNISVSLNTQYLCHYGHSFLSVEMTFYHIRHYIF